MVRHRLPASGSEAEHGSSCRTWTEVLDHIGSCSTVSSTWAQSAETGYWFGPGRGIGSQSRPRSARGGNSRALGTHRKASGHDYCRLKIRRYLVRLGHGDIFHHGLVLLHRRGRIQDRRQLAFQFGGPSEPFPLDLIFRQVLIIHPKRFLFRSQTIHHDGRTGGV